MNNNIAEKLQIIYNGVNTEGDLINQITMALENKAGNNNELKLQEKTVTSSFFTQTITADDSYDGLSKVIINGMPISILDSDIIIRSTAPGTVISTVVTLNGLTTFQQDLTYAPGPQRYQLLPDGLIIDTPVIILTSGTITITIPDGYTTTLIASGTDYKIYKFNISESDY